MSTKASQPEEGRPISTSGQKTTQVLPPGHQTKSFRTCPRHGEYEAIATALAYNPDNPFQARRGQKFLYSKCPKCAAEDKEKEKRSRINDFRVVVQHQTKLASIPARYKEYDINTLTPWNEEQGKIISRCRNYAVNFLDVRALGTSLIFLGQPGTGKTLIGLSMSRQIIDVVARERLGANVDKNDRVAIATKTQIFKYANAYDLSTGVKETYTKGTNLTEKNIIERYTAPDFLILDEVGIHSTSYEDKLVFNIVNTRYLAEKPTIVISNLSEEELTKKVGRHFIDRFHENLGEIFVFNWDSARQTERDNYGLE
jgi:DNA replication protein DnaC